MKVGPTAPVVLHTICKRAIPLQPSPPATQRCLHTTRFSLPLPPRADARVHRAAACYLIDGGKAMNIILSAPWASVLLFECLTNRCDGLHPPLTTGTLLIARALARAPLVDVHVFILYPRRVPVTCPPAC